MQIDAPIALEEIPEYQEAIARENFLRRATFLELSENVAGFPLRQMTPRAHLFLMLAQNPVIIGGSISPLDLADFLWMLSPAYKPKSKFRRRVYLSRCAHFFPPRLPIFQTARAIARYKLAVEKYTVEFHRVLNAVTEYLDDIFQDAPASTGGTVRKSYYSETAGLISIFAREFGWTRNETLDTPLPQIFQMLKEMSEHHAIAAGQKPLLVNNRSETVLAQCMLQYNRVGVQASACPRESKN